MNQSQESEFAKASSMPLLAVLGVMAVAGFVTCQSVRFAFETAQRMMCVWEGRDAAILFMVARRTIWQAVMVGGGLYFIWRMVKAKTSLNQLASVVSGFKMMAAVVMSVKASGFLGLWLGSHFPICNDSLSCLHGWRLFQIADLMLLFLMIPLVMGVANIAQSRLMSARTRGRGVLIAGSVIALFAGLCVVDPVRDDPRHEVRHHEDEREEEEVEESTPGKYDGYRLTEDEPWEVKG